MIAAAQGDERLARLRLARTDRIGPVAFSQLIARFGSARAALDALPDMARRAGGAALIAPQVEAVDRELAAGEAAGARLLLLGDADWPEPLAALDPPPPLLWALGDPALMLRPCIALVGARSASAAGQRVARGLAAQLSEVGWVVVSGMARGVDAAAHAGALPGGTVAVLGGGVDDIYPAEHAALHAEIADRGCVVSESPMGARAQARDFPRRNRIIAGLSRAVVVVEAELRSGSLITARLAAEQGREVLAVPGSPLDPRARGTNDLIRQGAWLCEGIEDIERALSAPGALREPPADPFDGPTEAADAALLERVASLLSPTPAPRDELARALNEPVARVAGALLELSLAGRCELLPGGLVCAT